jgi:uncharacterized membrane protein
MIDFFELFLINNNYIVNKENFKKFLLSHPDYPSLNTFKDTLNELNIENVFINLSADDFGDVLVHSILQLQNINKSKSELVILSDISQDSISFYNQKLQFISLEKHLFFSLWTGIVVAIEKKEKATNLDTPSHKNQFKLLSKFIVCNIIGLILVYSLWKFNVSEIAYIIISIVGLYYCFEIYKNQHGEKSIIVDKICRDEKEESSCQKLMKSDPINIFGLKLSDIALFYFITTVILGLFINNNTQFLIITLSILIFPVIVYSLYIQLVKEKKLCKICLILSAILLVQSGISLLFFNYCFSLEVLILSAIYILSILPLYIFINKTIDENNKLKNENTINLRFKRNYDIFKRELLLTPKIEFEHQDLFFLGNKDAKINITLISNLECKFCGEAHYILKKLYLENESDISFQIRFNFSDKKISPQFENVFKTLLNSYTLNEKRFLEALDFWYKERNYDAFIKKFDLHNNQNTELILKIKDENLTKKLNFTPAFLLNGYIFPQKYEREDILYFIHDLLDDEDI